MSVAAAEGSSAGPVSWGVLGAARIAREQVVPAMARSGAGTVVAVSSASGRARTFAADLQVGRAYDDHADLLADPGVEAVYIALPNAEHARWVLAAVRAGKHVLCEKPLVMSPGELAEVEQAAERHGVMVGEAFMWRHHAQVAVVASVLQDGLLGDLLSVHAGLHFTLERGAPGDRPDIRLSPELGGGALRDLGCYPLDLFGWLTGAEPDEVAAVAVRDSPTGVDTRVGALLRYGGVVATLDCSFDAPLSGTARLVGTRGVLRLDDVFRADVRGGRARVLLEGPDGVRDLGVTGDQYADQMADVCARIRSGVPDVEGWALTGRTVRTLDRVARAIAG